MARGSTLVDSSYRDICFCCVLGEDSKWLKKFYTSGEAGWGVGWCRDEACYIRRFPYEQKVSLLSGHSREIVGLLVSLLYRRAADTSSKCFHCSLLTPTLKPGCLL